MQRDCPTLIAHFSPITCCALVFATLLSVAPRAEAQDLIPEAETQANASTGGDQRFPHLDSDPTGNFVLVWESDSSLGNDSDARSIQALRMSPTGERLLTEFQVNEFTLRDQFDPTVGVADNGNFVVVWVSEDIEIPPSYENPDGSIDQNIVGQRFAADGTRLGAEFRVNDFTTDAQRRPAIAVGAAGDFIVTWESDASPGDDADQSSIHMRRYDAAGMPLGLQEQVNTTTTGFQIGPAIALASDGKFAIAWESNDEIKGQLYTALGAPDGGELPLSPAGASFSASGADLDFFTDGTFAATWTEFEIDPYNNVIRVRRFMANGAPLGDGVPLAGTFRGCSRIRVTPAGGFDAMWSDGGFPNGVDGSGAGTFMQRFDAAFAPGSVVQIHQVTAGAQVCPVPAHDTNGGLLVAWQSDSSNGDDTDGTSVQMRRFILPIFADGFESGNFEAWSAVEPMP